jgi:NADH-quinone oxidoreductase subunit H
MQMLIDLFLEYFPIVFFIVLKILMITIPLVLSVAYLTYAERKVIAAMQMRRGPNVVGPFGLLQPIADAVKLMFKEIIVPDRSNKILFIMAPMITFILSLVAWAVIPIGFS